MIFVFLAVFVVITVSDTLCNKHQSEVSAPASAHQVLPVPGGTSAPGRQLAFHGAADTFSVHLHVCC